MVEYHVIPLTTGFISGTLSDKKLQTALNKEADHGWHLVRSIHEHKKVFGIFSRESHFLVFEREKSGG